MPPSVVDPKSPKKWSRQSRPAIVTRIPVDSHRIMSSRVPCGRSKGPKPPFVPQVRLVERLHTDFIRAGARFDSEAQAKYVLDECGGRGCSMV